jgi:hypothetical protein
MPPLSVPVALIDQVRFDSVEPGLTALVNLWKIVKSQVESQQYLYRRGRPFSKYEPVSSFFECL